MKFGDLITLTTQMTGQTAVAVRATLRSLREAGHLTTAGRRGGFGAPDMLPLDVARLLVTCLAFEVPGTRGPEAVERFGGLRCTLRQPWVPLSLEALRGLHPPFTFLEALAGLVAIYAFDRNSEAYGEAVSLMRDGTRFEPEAHVFLSHDQTGARAAIHLAARRESGMSYQFSEALRPVATARHLPDARFDPLLTRSAELREGTILHFARHLRPQQAPGRGEGE